MPALHANNGAFPFRRAFIHASRGSTCRPRSTPTNSRVVATHQEQPMPLRQIAGAHDHPSTAPSREMRFHSRPAFIHAWRGSTCRPRSTPTNSSVVNTHQQPRGRHPPTAAGTCRRRGGSGCGGVSRMGPRHASGGLGRTPNPGLAVCAGQRTRASGDRAYMDVLAASPATGPTPPSHGMPAFDVDVDSAGAGRSPANRPHPHLTPRSAESASG